MANTRSLASKPTAVRALAARIFCLVLIVCIALPGFAARAQTDGPEQPHFDLDAERFFSFDGAALGLSAWTPESHGVDEEPWAVIVGLHGMNDYAHAFYPAGPWFAARGVAVYAYDARGFGRSPLRGAWPGEALMIADLKAAIESARNLHPSALIAVVGDSMGGAAAIAAFGGNDPPDADRIVLVAPAVWGWSAMLDMTRGALTGAPGQGATDGPRQIIASDNEDMLRRLGQDPNMILTARMDAVYGLVQLMESASRKIENLHGHVAFLYGANDRIIPRQAALRAAGRLPTSARTAYYANGYHMLLRDLQAEVVYADILSFLREPEAPLPSMVPPLFPPESETEMMPAQGVH